MSRTLIIEMEWPGEGITEEVELPDDATDKEADGEAADAFFNHCNYGWRWKDAPDEPSPDHQT